MGLFSYIKIIRPYKIYMLMIIMSIRKEATYQLFSINLTLSKNPPYHIYYQRDLDIVLPYFTAITNSKSRLFQKRKGRFFIGPN